MNARTVLAELQKLGTAQNQKIYGRHGVKGPCFGVSYADLGKVAKQIGHDQNLATDLWKSGNHDARILATMVVDPAQTKATQLDRWVKVLDNYVLTDAVSALASQSPTAKNRMKKWMSSKQEFISAAGWNILVHRGEDLDFVDEAEAAAYLAEIKADIHARPNRVRHSMNAALIVMGLRDSKMHKKAVAVAKKIGVVEVDHGETSCKTPDAIGYMDKTLKHRLSKQKSAEAKTIGK
jgi:3-methyladenine DNA glycosylase AlkD